MLIGHLPAGYFITRYLIKKNKLPLNKFWLGLGLLGSVLPDFDLIYTLFINTTISSHRNLPTYIPLFWLILFLLCLASYAIWHKKWIKYGAIVLFGNVLIHLILDTPFVGVKWLWPFYDKLVGIYNVGLTSGFLVENYFQHWYWYLEIALWIAAIISIINSNKKGELK